MTTLSQRPTVGDVANALIAAADPRTEHSAEEFALLAQGLLPGMSVGDAALALDGIRSHLRTAQSYAAATPETARKLFGDCGCDHNSAIAFAQCLNERAAVWQGEAETLALTTARRDREGVLR